ncbi:Putative SOS response-associated peptidase YedK [Rhizobiales bacterium GAS188]|nr:Putative SOS response-associated peptidase YedK [Rhizobiales bacterium GAS188]
MRSTVLSRSSEPQSAPHLDLGEPATAPLQRLEPQIVRSAAPREPQLVFLCNPITGAAQEAELDWGLIPNFEKSWPSIRPINARAETIREKRIFAESYRLRRCVVPMSSYFQKDGSGKRHTIGRADGQLFGVAGIWDSWTDPDTKQVIRTFASITVAANTLIAPIHDRMPAILENTEFRRWFGEEEDPFDLLRPYPAERMSVVAGRTKPRLF